MKKLLIITLLALSLFLIACEPGTSPENCDEPYVLLNEECCLDNNNNDLCDRNEVIEEEEELPDIVLEERKEIEKAIELVHINPVLTVYGKEGFSPMELKVGVGEPLLVRNEFESLIKPGIVVLFQKDGGVGSMNTPTIKHGETEEMIFEELGNYTCWILQYPQRCKVIVE